MKVVKWLLWAIVALVLVFVGGGFVLSGEYRVVRSINISAPAEKVYPLLEDPRAWARWTVWNQRDPAMKVSYSGAATGAGAAWKWESATEGTGEMTFTRADAPKTLEYKLWFPEFKSGSTGELTLTPVAGGVRLVWSNTGKMDAKPIGGWLALFMDRMIGPDFEGGLRNLKTLAEKP